MAETWAGNIKTTKLGIVSGITYGKEESGLIINGRHIEPYWMGTFTTPPLTEIERIQQLHLLDRYVDLSIRVDYVHPRYALPYNYTAATWPLVSDPQLHGITDLRHLTISGLQVGMTLPAGTRFTLVQDDLRCYRKVTSDVVVGSSVSQAIEVTPRIPPGIFAPGCSAVFKNPMVRMLVVPESWDASEDIEDEPLSWDMWESLS